MPITAEQQIAFEAKVTQTTAQGNLARFQAVSFLLTHGITPESMPIDSKPSER